VVYGSGRATPYGLTGLGLMIGLAVLLFEPLSTPLGNYVAGGGFLAVAVASVTHLIVEFSGPGERGPDF